MVEQPQCLAECNSRKVLLVSMEVVVTTITKHSTTSIVLDHVKDVLEKSCG